MVVGQIPSEDSVVIFCGTKTSGHERVYDTFITSIRNLQDFNEVPTSGTLMLTDLQREIIEGNFQQLSENVVANLNRILFEEDGSNFIKHSLLAIGVHGLYGSHPYFNDPPSTNHNK